MEALLVRDGAVDVLGVDALVVDDELGVLVVGAKLLDGVFYSIVSIRYTIFQPIALPRALQPMMAEKSKAAGP